MAVPSTQNLLAAWERGQAVPQQAERAIALLFAAHAEMPRAAVAALPIGERDRRLLSLHQDMFGSQFKGLTTCPECNTSLELKFEVDDFGTSSNDDIAVGEAVGPLSFKQDGYEIVYRQPDSLDLLALREGDSDDANKFRLLQRVVLHASCGQEEIPASELPMALVEALDARLSLADAHADIRLNLNCTACAACWRAPFDIASYLWSEVDAWALRLLRDVHRLARAYGWREADILALSSSRRQCYLDMLDE
jgi:hypothetical protein